MYVHETIRPRVLSFPRSFVLVELPLEDRCAFPGTQSLPSTDRDHESNTVMRLLPCTNEPYFPVILSIATGTSTLPWDDWTG